MTDSARGTGAATFVPRDERERILEAFAELVAEDGYPRARAERVAELAGVHRDTFDRYFSTTEDCLIAACDALAEQAFSAAAEAFVATPGSWAEAVHAALAALLAFVAGTPAFARVTTIELAAHAGIRGEAHHRDALELFSQFLEPGYAEADADGPVPPRVTSRAIAGGVFEVIRSHVVTERLDELPAALPGLTFVMLTPFIRPEEARRIATTA